MALCTLAGKIHLEGVKATDIEDIAIGPSSNKTRDYLYLGDIGNNRGTRKEIYIYKFLEPKIDQTRYNTALYIYIYIYIYIIQILCKVVYYIVLFYT